MFFARPLQAVDPCGRDLPHARVGRSGVGTRLSFCVVVMQKFCPPVYVFFYVFAGDFSYGYWREFAIPPAFDLFARRPKPVPATIVDAWDSVHDAALWSYEQRTDSGAKTRAWFAEHMQMRPQHLTRLLDKQDLKLDAVQSHVRDCLTGWSAIAQFVDAQKHRIAQDAAEQITAAMKARPASMNPLISFCSGARWSGACGAGLKRPSFQFYPGDWTSNPNLRRCTFAEKGVWFEVMCLMHDQEEYGVLRWPLKEIADTVKCRVADLQALIRKGVLKGHDTQLDEPFIYVRAQWSQGWRPGTFGAHPSRPYLVLKPHGEG